MKTIKTSLIICNECEKLFQGKYAFLCPECLRKMRSDNAKKIGLNRLGNNAYSKKQAEGRCGK